jgi:hypothetical protein
MAEGMDFWGLFWLILAFGALAVIVIVLIFAIIEPGPLQNQRGFGRKRKQAEISPDEEEGS